MAKDIKNAVKRIHNSKETATLFLTPGFVPRAEALTRPHGKARCQARSKTDDEKGDGARTPHTRHRVRRNGVTDNQRIRHIVELLKNIPDEHGQHKTENQSEGTAFRQFLSHTFFSDIDRYLSFEVGIL